MATTYPGTVQTFTNPSGTSTLDNPDHATQHANENDTLVAIQNTLGTTTGTALFTAFSASDKPAKKNNETFGTPTITGGTINNAAVTTPKITTSINDANGNEIIKTPATASAVNEITVTNAATGNAPIISATGDDTNIPLALKGKNAGVQATGEYDNGNTSTAQTINGTNGDSQLSTVTGNVTYTFSNFTKGQKVVLRIVEDGTGSHTITLPTVKWPGGTAGTFTTTANAINLLAIYYDGTNYLTQLAAGFA